MLIELNYFKISMFASLNTFLGDFYFDCVYVITHFVDTLKLYIIFFLNHFFYNEDYLYGRHVLNHYFSHEVLTFNLT